MINQGRPEEQAIQHVCEGQDIHVSISIEIGKRRFQIGDVCMHDELLLNWILKK
jgi:hypothetical protein